MTAADRIDREGHPLGRRHQLRVVDDRRQRLHGANRIRAGRGLAGEHDRVRPFVHRVCRIADLGASGTRTFAHRLEDLCGDDHGPPSARAAANNQLLHAGHLLEGHLEPEIAARDHHAISSTEHGVEVLDGRGALDLRDDRRGTSGVGHDLLRAQHVVHRLHETQRHEIHSQLEAEPQIGGVLLGHRRCRQARRRAR